MRVLHATLTAAQRAASRKPYLRIYFDDRAGDTYTYTTKDTVNRVVYIEQWEEPYAGLTLLRLSNYDRHFTNMDLRGYSVTVGWGMELDDTPDANWFSNAAPMKVRMQRDISYEGMLVTEFYCVSIWAEIEKNYILKGGKKLTGTIAGTFELGEKVTQATTGATGRVACISGGYIVITRESETEFSGAYICTGGTSGATVTTVTVTTNYGMLVYASGEDPAVTTKVRIEELTGLTVDVDEDDPLGSMADDPRLEVKVGTSVRQVIRRMLLRTKCGMRYEADGHMHVLYLDTSDAAQYPFDETHAFFVDFRERAIIMPNTVVVASGLLDDKQVPAYTGTANDAFSVARIGPIVAPIQIDPDAASQADVDNRAAAWIAQQVAEANQGQIVAPMECGLEVYDMVQSLDSRLNAISKGRIGRIERIFEPAKRAYEVRINLGSLFSQPGAMDVGPDSRANDLRDLVSSLDEKPPTVAPTVYPWQLWQSVQPYTVSIDFTAGGATGDKEHMAWGAGHIYFKDGTSLVIDANADYAIGATAGWLYFTESDATLNFTTDLSVAVAPANGIVAFIARGTEVGNTCLILPYSGKSPALNADIITCIQLSALAANLGTITAGEISGVTITVTGTGQLIIKYGANIVGWLDGIDGGLHIIGQDDVFLTTPATGGVSMGAGLTPTVPGVNEFNLQAAGPFGIGSGSNAPNPTGNDIWIDSDDDVWIFAELDIYIYPSAGQKLEVRYLALSWSDVTGSRAIGSEYQNTGTEPLVVLVTLQLDDGDTAVAKIGTVSGSLTVVSGVDNSTGAGSLISCLPVLVPIGYYYEVTATVGTPTLADWHEYGIGG